MLPFLLYASCIAINLDNTVQNKYNNYNLNEIKWQLEPTLRLLSNLIKAKATEMSPYFP